MCILGIIHRRSIVSIIPYLFLNLPDDWSVVIDCQVVTPILIMCWCVFSFLIIDSDQTSQPYLLLCEGVQVSRGELQLPSQQDSVQ